jgi:hypothetical protein
MTAAHQTEAVMTAAIEHGAMLRNATAVLMSLVGYAGRETGMPTQTSPPAATLA